MSDATILIGCPDCKGLFVIDPTTQTEDCPRCTETNRLPEASALGAPDPVSTESAVNRDRCTDALTTIADRAARIEDGAANAELKRFAGHVRRMAEDALFAGYPYRDALSTISSETRILEYVTEDPELETFARKMFIEAETALTEGEMR